jgi:hypothetical protein
MTKTNHFRKELDDLAKRASKEDQDLAKRKPSKEDSEDEKSEHPALRLPYSSDFEPVGEVWN